MQRQWKHLVAVVILAVLGLSSVAQASHFRYATISWTRDPGTRNVTFTITSAWRCCPGATFNFGDGTSVNFRGGAQIASFSNYQIYRGTLTHTYAGDGPYTVSYSSCCRIGGIKNASGNFRVAAGVDLSGGNGGSPVSSAPAILQIVKGGLNVLPLPVVDPDGDSLTCRLGTSGEAGGSYSTPSAGGHTLSLAEPCALSWDTSGTAVNQLWALHMRVSEAGRPGSFTELDFFLQIVDGSLNSPPTCVVDGLQNPFVAVPDQPIAISITATDPEGGPLSVASSGLPSGAALSPLSGSSPLTTVFSWTPTVADRGTAQAVTLQFTDNGGLQATCPFSIQIPDNQPPECSGDATTIVAHNVGMQITRTLTFIDPDGDTLTQAGATSLPAGAMVSSTGGPGVLEMTVDWTPAIDQVGTHTITLASQDTSGALATCSFDVEVIDIPPKCDVAEDFIPIFVGETVHHEVTAFDDDPGDSVTVAVPGGLPPGATLTPAEGWTGPAPLTVALDWTPTIDDVGTHPVTLAFTDSRGITGSCILLVIVQNRAPACSAPTVTWEGYTCDQASVSWTVTDPDPGDSLALVDDSTLPEGAMLTVSGEGTSSMEVRMDWTPEISQADQSFTIAPVVEDAWGETVGCPVTLHVLDHAPTCGIMVDPAFELEEHDEYIVNVGQTFVAVAMGTDEDECESLTLSGFVPHGSSVTPPLGTTGGSTMEATFTWTPTDVDAEHDDHGHGHVVNLSFSDSRRESGCAIDVRVNARPRADIVLTQLTNIGNEALVRLDGLASTDAEDDPADLVYEWFIDGEPLCGGTRAQCAVVEESFAYGSQAVTLRVTDTRGSTDEAMTTFSVDPADLAIFECEQIEVKFCLGDADSDSHDDDSSADDQSKTCTHDRVKIKGEIGLPIGVDFADLQPMSMVSLRVAGQADLLATAVVPLIMDAHGGDGDHWKLAEPTLGIEKLEIDWNGARFKFDESGYPVKLKSELITSTHAILTMEYKMKDIGGAFSLDIGGQATVSVDAEGAVSADVPLRVKKKGKKVTIELPFPIIEGTLLTLGGALDRTVIAADHYTHSLGRFKLEARADQLFPNGADTLPREVDLAIFVGAQFYAGSCEAGPDKLKVHSRKWRAKK